MPVDPIFGDTRLAAVYDAFDGGRGDLEAYDAIVAELGATRILDIGCGTGTLALRLAARGLTVTGVDPAAASIAVARAKPGADKVTWIAGYADAAPAMGADLALMTGNAAQALLTDDDWAQLLTGVRAALRPGGYFVFEARRPERRIWEEWQHENRHETRDVPGIGHVTQDFTVTEIRLPYVSFRYTYEFADATTVESDSTLWFQTQDQIHTKLFAYAFNVLETRQAPDRPGLENVFLTQLA